MLESKSFGPVAIQSRMLTSRRPSADIEYRMFPIVTERKKDKVKVLSIPQYLTLNESLLNMPHNCDRAILTKNQKEVEKMCGSKWVDIKDPRLTAIVDMGSHHIVSILGVQELLVSCSKPHLLRSLGYMLVNINKICKIQLKDDPDFIQRDETLKNSNVDSDITVLYNGKVTTVEDIVLISRLTNEVVTLAGGFSGAIFLGVFIVGIFMCIYLEYRGSKQKGGDLLMEEEAYPYDKSILEAGSHDRSSRIDKGPSSRNNTTHDISLPKYVG